MGLISSIFRITIKNTLEMHEFNSEFCNNSLPTRHSFSIHEGKWERQLFEPIIRWRIGMVEG